MVAADEDVAVGATDVGGGGGAVDVELGEVVAVVVGEGLGIRTNGALGDVSGAVVRGVSGGADRGPGVNEGTLGNWVNQARAAREGHGELAKDDYEELRRLRAEVAELRMERDVLKRSVVLWVKEATK